MNLVTTNEPNMCVACSLAMLTGLPLKEVQRQLFLGLEYPFDPPFEKLPKVPSMDVVVDWLFQRRVSATPFERNPYCSPHETCNSVPVWYNGDRKFQKQLNYGLGLLEGYTGDIGHMCYWNGEIYDPRGAVYKYEQAEKYGFEIERVWICRFL